MKLFHPKQQTSIEGGRAECLNKFILQKYGELNVGMEEEEQQGAAEGQQAPAPPSVRACRPRTLHS
eukprot:11476484-Prorocentrum_lima.AAC.1